MAKNNFLRDLYRGNKAEQLIINLFSSAGFPSQTDKESRSKWDIVSNYGKICITTEVKFDEYEQRSGNIAIETHNPRLDKPSGLMVTEAFLWAHVLKGGVVWVTRVESLRKYVDNTKPKRIIKNGGDGNATLSLYSSNTILLDVFTRIDTMNEDDLRNFIINTWEKTNV